MKHLDTSPIKNHPLRAYLTCIDYTVSGEKFTIRRDEETELLVTTPRPNDEKLGDYYESLAYISHTDAKRSLFDRIYQMVRNYTIRKKIKLISSFRFSQNTLLDIGTGTGDFLLACKKANWTTHGVEPNEKARGIAEEKLGQKMQVDISELEDQKYDIITMWHVLEHIPNLETYILRLKSLLNENGKLLIAVPNHKSADANYYGRFWAAYDVPRHLWHFSQKSMAAIFNDVNMKITKTLPMRFDAYYVSLLSEKYKTGKMNALKAFSIGFRSNFKARKTGEYSSLIYVIEKSN